ncbi:MAG TPA: hypothetical protein VH724_14665 [Candidatus Angelobacter sp.]|nr:hypothetical protein [Candidatus Angelobacter sp.]
MGDSSMSSVITGLVSGVISSALTYFGTRSKLRLDMTAEYDKDLRQKRLELYKDLWPKTKPLAEFSAESPLTYGIVKAVSTEMRDWYFAEGGIYLSRNSRGPYFHLKKLMQTVLDDGQLRQSPGKELALEQAGEILTAARELRTSLADDIGARQAPWL